MSRFCLYLQKPRAETQQIFGLQQKEKKKKKLCRSDDWDDGGDIASEEDFSCSARHTWQVLVVRPDHDGCVYHSTQGNTMAGGKKKHLVNGGPSR